MSYNFTNTNTNTNTNTSSSVNQSKTDYVIIDVTFGKIMEDIANTWKKLHERQNTINQDIQHLERMFNVYSNNALFYQGKEALHQEKATNMQKILQLEEQIFLVKRNSTALL